MSTTAEAELVDDSTTQEKSDASASVLVGKPQELLPQLCVGNGEFALLRNFSKYITLLSDLSVHD